MIFCLCGRGLIQFSGEAIDISRIGCIFVAIYSPWGPYINDVRREEGGFANFLPMKGRLREIATLETVYKVAICPRGNLPYKQIYLTRDLMLLENVNWGIEISSP